MRTHLAVVDSIVLLESRDEATVPFEPSSPALLFTAKYPGVPLEWSVVIQHGEATMMITEPRDKLSRFAERLESSGMTFDIEYDGHLQLLFRGLIRCGGIP